MGDEGPERGVEGKEGDMLSGDLHSLCFRLLSGVVVYVLWTDERTTI